MQNAWAWLPPPAFMPPAPMPPSPPPLIVLVVVVVVPVVVVPVVVDRVVVPVPVVVVSSSLQPLAAAEATRNIALNRPTTCVVFTVLILLSAPRPLGRSRVYASGVRRCEHKDDTLWPGVHATV